GLGSFVEDTTKTCVKNADVDHVLEDARDSGHAVPLMYAQFHTSLTNVLCAKYAAANAQSSGVVRLAEEKGAALWSFGNDAKRLRISAVRQGFGGNPDDHLRDHHVSVNRIKTVSASLLVTFVQSLCGTWPI